MKPGIQGMSHATCRDTTARTGASRARRSRSVIGLRRALGLLVVFALLQATPVGADAPPGRFTVTADTVLDTTTGLTWQRAVPIGAYTWANAVTYCQALSLSGGGWRLPASKELESLVDIRLRGPAIDRTAFPGTPSTTFWTSTPDATEANVAWRLDFTDGNEDTIHMTIAYRVRCVR